MQGDTLILKKKLDDATTAMMLANDPPYTERHIALTYSEMMLIWTALDLRDAIRDVTKNP
jgi:hypothetical protein